MSLITQLVKIHLQCRRPQLDFWVGKILWRRDRPPTPVFLSFPCGSAGKESACNVRDLGSIPRLGKHPGGGKGYLLQRCGLENSMDCVVHRIAKSRTWLSNFHFHYKTLNLTWYNGRHSYFHNLFSCVMRIQIFLAFFCFTSTADQNNWIVRKKT